MTSALRRPALLITSLAVLGTALTACGSGPSQVNSAVIIGDRVISVDDVQHRLDTALGNEGATKDLARNHKLDLVSRGIVNQLIRHELLAEAAKREGLNVTEKDVADNVAQTAPPQDPVQRAVEAGFDAHEIAKDRLLVQALGHKYVDKLEVTFDGASVVSPANSKAVATDLARKLAADPSKSSDIVQKAQSDELSPAVDQSFNPINTYGIYQQYQQQIVLTPIFGAKENTVVAFPVGSGEQAATTGWLVALIKKRSTSASLPEDQASVASQVDPAWEQAVGLQLISPLATELGVRISPRYGVWDELAVGLAPSEGEKIGVVIPVASPKQ